MPDFDADKLRSLKAKAHAKFVDIQRLENDPQAVHSGRAAQAERSYESALKELDDYVRVFVYDGVR
jgi:hypothetical protein